MSININEIIFFDGDTQVDFLSPRGKLYIKGSSKIIPNLKKLTDFAKQNNIPIVAAVDTHTANDPEFKVFPPHCVKGTLGHKKINETNLEGASIIENKKTDIIDKMKPVILEKNVYDVFSNVNTEKVFEVFKRKKVILYGVATDYCLRAVAFGLKKRGYEVTIVNDAIKEIDPEMGKKTIREMKLSGIEFLATKELIEHLKR